MRYLFPILLSVSGLILFITAVYFYWIDYPSVPFCNAYKCVNRSQIPSSFTRPPIPYSVTAAFALSGLALQISGLFILLARFFGGLYHNYLGR